MSKDKGFSESYFGKAQKELASLTGDQRDLLQQINDPWVWAEAGVLAWMEALEEKVISLGRDKKDLCEYFPDLTDSAVYHWFTDCSISLKYFLRLQKIPYLADVRPDPVRLQLHRNRVAIRWIRRGVLDDDTTPKRQLQWEEYRFLDFVHQHCDGNVAGSFARCPNEWKSCKCSEDWLKAVLEQWGTAFRLFRLEVNRGR